MMIGHPSSWVQAAQVLNKPLKFGGVIWGNCTGFIPGHDTILLT
jgi:hypothetical protein